MGIVADLQRIWRDSSEPFLISNEGSLRFADLRIPDTDRLAGVQSGDVVALIGDFSPESISILLHLVDKGCIVVPLTHATAHEHSYFFEAASVDVVISSAGVKRLDERAPHPMLEQLRASGRAGLVLFSSGTTGRPKAILHDLTEFMKRYMTPRPTLTTFGFLLFDHIGGINTLFHTLFNKGTVVSATSRAIDEVLEVCARHSVELLPTTPTFLRMLLMSGALPHKVPESLKVITYGTERFDQSTLEELCSLLPHVDFRQTYGMSELGILRVRSRSRDSLFMKVGGEGVETRVVDGILQIRSATRMIGYLNAPSPFDAEGWYNTKDVVEVDGDHIRITGRDSDVVNVGGVKFMTADVERVVLDYPHVAFAHVTARPNPITGQHVEVTVQPQEAQTVDPELIAAYLKDTLPRHMVPRRVRVGEIAVGHRFKRL